MATDVDFQTIQRNLAAGRIKHFNQCKANFMRDNRVEIEDMFDTVKQGKTIEILSGPCAGKIIANRAQVYDWIDAQVEDMSK